MSNTVKLTKPVKRELTDQIVEGVPLMWNITPGGIVYMWKKGERKPHKVKVMTIWDNLEKLIALENGTATELQVPVRGHKTVSKPKEKEKPLQIPTIVKPLLELMQEHKGPIHRKTLDSLMRGQCEGPELQRLYDTLVKDHKIEKVQPFHFQAV